MKIIATKRTAALAGAWTGVGAIAFDLWVRMYPTQSNARPIVFIFGAIPFFFIPMFVLVFGSQKSGSLIKGMFESAGRGLCWMLGAVLVAGFGLALVSRYAS